MSFVCASEVLRCSGIKCVHILVNLRNKINKIKYKWDMHNCIWYNIWQSSEHEVTVDTSHDRRLNWIIDFAKSAQSLRKYRLNKQWELTCFPAWRKFSGDSYEGGGKQPQCQRCVHFVRWCEPGNQWTAAYRSETMRSKISTQLVYIIKLSGLSHCGDCNWIRAVYLNNT